MLAKTRLGKIFIICKSIFILRKRHGKSTVRYRSWSSLFCSLMYNSSVFLTIRRRSASWTESFTAKIIARGILNMDQCYQYSEISKLMTKKIWCLNFIQYHLFCLRANLFYYVWDLHSWHIPKHKNGEPLRIEQSLTSDRAILELPNISNIYLRGLTVVVLVIQAGHVSL